VDQNDQEPNPDFNQNDNNNPSPENIYELPPEETIKNDNPVDIFPDLSPPDLTESEEEVKKQFIKNIGEEN
jgi:hypothetical protein